MWILRFLAYTLHFLAVRTDECLSVDWLLHVEFYRRPADSAFASVFIVDEEERFYPFMLQLELEKFSA